MANTTRVMLDDGWRLSLRQMSIFRAVAQSGSLRSAARQVHLTQPAVTHAVRDMEQSLGTALFVRSAKGVALTDVGAVLMRRTELVFNELRRTQDEIRELRDGTGGRLSIAFSSAAGPLLPPALLDFRARRPGVSLELHEMISAGSDPRWQSGSFDFAVVSESAVTPMDGAQSEALLEVPLRVGLRQGHALARARSLKRLHGALWVAPSYGLALLERLFAAHGLPPPPDVIACQSTQLGTQLMHRADALALMSSDMASDSRYSRGLSWLSLTETPLPHLRIYLLVRDEAALTPAARLFIDCLRRAVTARWRSGAARRPVQNGPQGAQAPDSGSSGPLAP